MAFPSAAISNRIDTAASREEDRPTEDNVAKAKARATRSSGRTGQRRTTPQAEENISESGELDGHIA
jgi:hypothetical protein